MLAPVGERVGNAARADAGNDHRPGCRAETMGWRALSGRAARGFSPPHLHARPGATLGANRKAFYSYYPQAELSVCIRPALLPLLEAMMLVDSDAWQLFDAANKARFRQSTLAVFADVRRLVGE